MLIRRVLLAATALALMVPAATSAAVRLDPIGTFTDPVYVTSLPDDPDRLLVVEQRGTIELVDHGVASTFLDLATPGLVLKGTERGLFSVAPAPDYATSHRLYVIYTRAPSGAVEVDEFRANGDSVPLSSRRVLLQEPHPDLYENGGQLVFGPDGFLYVTIGDNGALENGQRLDTVSGKILRIDPHPSGSAPYAIPAGNPFAGSATARNEIWTYGVRNPWRISFDRATGSMLIGEVGQFDREEVDYFPGPNPARAANLGWDCREGSIAFPYAPASCGPSSAYTEPIYDFPHPENDCAAVVGGYVVRDSSLGDLYGRYLFTDTCNGDDPVAGATASDGHRRALRGPARRSPLELRRGRLRADLRHLARQRRGLAPRGRRTRPVRRQPGRRRWRRRRRRRRWRSSRAALRRRAGDTDGGRGWIGQRLARRRRDRRRWAQQQDPLGSGRRHHLRPRRPRSDPCAGPAATGSAAAPARTCATAARAATAPGPASAQPSSAVSTMRSCSRRCAAG